ncbi:MAG: hypothetical protein SFV21_02560, partial [Rhodospirillaceae bacterium]|nr:hypothetical protein [Rhodospirillaceae bacterium]
VQTGGSILSEQNNTMTLSGAITLGTPGKLRINANGSAAETNVSGTITNSGAIELDSSSGGADATLDLLSTGSIVMNAGGIIQAVAGSGGTRFIRNGTITGAGTLDIDQNTTFSNLDVVTTGTVDIASSKALTLTSTAGASTMALNGSASFAGGGSLVLAVGTELNFNSGTNITLSSTTAAVNVGSDGSASFFVNGTAVLKVNNTLDADQGRISGDFTIGSTGILLSEQNNTMSVDGSITIDSGGQLKVNANGSSAELNFGGVILFNSGTILLTSDSASSVTMDFTAAGTINNAAGGVIRTSIGAGGARTFKAVAISNQGSIDIDQDTTYQGAATITNSGSIDVALGKTLTLINSGGAPSMILNGSTTLGGGGTLSIDSGSTLTVNTAITLSSSTVALNVGATGSATVNGTGVITVANTLDADQGRITNALVVNTGGVILAEQSNTMTLSGSVTIGTSGILRVNANGSSAELNISGNVSNTGTIELTSSTSANSTLDLTGATLTNNNNGFFKIMAGAGGSRFVNGGAIVNDGFLTAVGAATGTISSSFTMGASGVIQVDDGASLTFANGFANPNAIQIRQTSGTTTSTFNVTSGTITNNSTIDVTNFTGNAMVANVGAAINNTGIFVLLDAQGAGSVTANFTKGVSNSQLFRLTASAGPGAAVTANFTGGGSFTNNSSGLLSIVAGNGGARTISGEINNLTGGTIDVETNTTFALGTTTLDNSGLFDVNAGVTANFTSTTAQFHNFASGTFSIDSSGTVKMNGTDIDNDGVLVVNGTLFMGDGIDNGADGGDLMNDGSITGSGAIFMEGGTFTGNAAGGSVTLNPGNSPGMLTIDGNIYFNDRSKVVIEIGGRNRVSEYDVLAVRGRFALGGTLAVAAYGAFAAAAGDSFDVIEWNSRSGMFHEAEGLDQHAGVALKPLFKDDGLTLQALAVTHDGGAGDDALNGTDGDDALVGRDGDDTLSGGLGSDLLLGGDGDDTLFGGAGDDTLVGGKGSDTAEYTSSTASISADLAAGRIADGLGGVDTVISVENIVGTGHDDLIVGDDRANVIVGGGGADTLTGGAGADVFVYRAPSEGGDIITDFVSGEDAIRLDGAGFGLTGAVAEGANFSVIGQAYDGANAGANAAFAANAPTLVYSTATHALYYDANGAEPGGYAILATLQPGATLTAADIQLAAGSLV